MAVLCLIVFATLQTNEKFASLGKDVILGGIAFASFVTGVVFVIVGTSYNNSYKALLGQNDPVTKAVRERYATRAQRSEVASGACYLLFALFWFAASRH